MILTEEEKSYIENFRVMVRLMGYTSRWYALPDAEFIQLAMPGQNGLMHIVIYSEQYSGMSEAVFYGKDKPSFRSINVVELLQWTMRELEKIKG